MPGWGFAWGKLGRWGSLSWTSTDVQGTEPLAKDDTLYYGRDDGSGIADLADDLSQYDDDQATGALWHYEAAPATRFNVLTSWCAEVDVTLNSTDTGRFFRYGPAAQSLGIRLSAGGVIEPLLNNSLRTGLTLPGISGSDQRFVIAWAVEPNLYTTGASDALRTELRAWNVTTGAYTQVTYTHEVRGSGTGDFIWWANDIAGTNAFIGTPNACRFSTGRFHAATETREDFVGHHSAPSLVGASRIEFPIVDPSCALGQAGEFAGPVHAMGAGATRAAAFRLLSPIVDECFLQRATFDGDDFSGLPESQFGTPAPDTDYTLFGVYRFHRNVPALADRLQCRVNVQQWRTSGSTPDRLHFRLYTMNRPSTSAFAVDQDKPFVSFFAEATIEAEHGSGASAGEWLDLGLTPAIARNSDGGTWLMLAVRAVDMSGALANTRFEIGGLVVEPVVNK